MTLFRPALSRRAFFSLAIVTLVAITHMRAMQVQGVVGGLVGGIAGAAPSQVNLPSGMISGSVIDDEGQPVSNALVQAWYETPQMDPGIRRQYATASAPTDRNGRFTLERLQPNEFLITAIPSGAPTQNTFQVTYFPGVTDAAQAQRVPPGDAAAKPLTIKVHRVPGFHVRGTVTSPSGRSPVGLSVQLSLRVFSSTYSRGVATVDPKGSFDIPGVAPGSYTLSTTLGYGALGYGSTGPDFGVADVTVENHDLEGVRLNLTSGGIVRGRLVLEKQPAGAAPLGLAVQTMPGMMTSGTMLPGRMPGSVPVAADWTFEIQGLYGLYRFNLQKQGLPDYALVRTVLDGRDIGNELDVSVKSGVHQLVFYLAHR